MISIFKHEMEEKIEKEFIKKLKEDGKCVVKGVATVTWDPETRKLNIYAEPGLYRKLES